MIDLGHSGELTSARWRKSSRSAEQGNCVEVAALSGDRIAIRDSKAPDDGVLLFTGSDFTTWLAAAKTGTFTA